MHKCNFCDATFNPRPQVKTPKACNKKECQKKRQRANEWDWHQRQGYSRDKEYHQIRRKQRAQKLSLATKILLKCLEVGKNLLDKWIDIEIFEEYLSRLISELGVKIVNKFWRDEKSNDFKELESTS